MIDTHGRVEFYSTLPYFKPMTTTHSSPYRVRRIIVCAVMLLFTHPCLFMQIQPGSQAVSLVVDYEIGAFSSAVSLSINSAGELVVLDAGADACIRYSVDGTELSRMQGRGWGSTEFDAPTDVSAAFPLAVFVADGKNHRVQQLDKELHFVQTISGSDQITTQQTGDAQLLTPTFRPVASTESQQGELFVVDADANRIVKFTTRLIADREFGTYASGDGRLSMPTDVCLTEDGKVAVSDDHRIVFFDQFGNYLFAHQLDTAMAARAVSSSLGDVIAVSSDEIDVIDAAPSSPEVNLQIRRSMVIGELVDEFRDAARTSALWFVLTPKSILVCKRAGL
jgi:hypothetical protein